MKNVFGNLKNVKLGKIIEGVKKSSPELLIAGGIISMATAIVLAIMNSPKAQKEIEEKEEMYKSEGKEMPIPDKVYTEAKHQAPSIALFITGTAAIIGANRVQNKRNVALALALQAGQTYAAELETKLKKMVGIETVEKAKAEMSDESKEGIHRYVETDNSTMKIRDNFTGVEFYSNVAIVERAVTELNKMLLNGESVSVSVFYELLGESAGQTNANKLMGWTANDKYGGFMLELEWFAEMQGTRPIAVFDYETEPSTDFWGNV